MVGLIRIPVLDEDDVGHACAERRRCRKRRGRQDLSLESNGTRFAPPQPGVARDPAAVGVPWIDGDRGIAVRGTGRTGCGQRRGHFIGEHARRRVVAEEPDARGERFGSRQAHGHAGRRWTRSVDDPRLARSDIKNVRVARRDGQRADRERVGWRADRLPGVAAVVAAEHPTLRRACVERRGIAGILDERTRAAPQVACAPLPPLPQVGIRGGGGGEIHGRTGSPADRRTAGCRGAARAMRRVLPADCPRGLRPFS